MPPTRLCSTTVTSTRRIHEVCLSGHGLRHRSRSPCRQALLIDGLYLIRGDGEAGYFWAKTDRKNPDSAWTRPLWAHLLDVACAAEALAEQLPAAMRQELAQQLGLKEPEAIRLLTLCIGLHDVGKAIPSFQCNHDFSREQIKGAGLMVKKQFDARERLHHGHASIPILHSWIARTPQAASIAPLLQTLTAFSGFHHGRLCEQKKWGPGKFGAEKIGNAQWRRVQQELVDEVARTWLSDSGWPVPMLPTSDPFPPELLAFAGWTTLSDWVGSMAEFMPEVRHEDDLHAYLPKSRKKVREALHMAGLDLGAAFRDITFEAAFPEVFEDYPSRQPRPLQQLSASIKLYPEPSLFIIEAPTGEGKSEAAFYLAACLQRRRNGSAYGIYIAMPTQATSNGLFPRFERFLTHVHDGAAGDAILRLVHGADALNLDQRRLFDTLEAFEPIEDEEGEREARVRTARWFTRRKRALLAPYGVGTVDQALLGTLLARHFFLRLYGLAGKVVVFDEVHAYDRYMSRLFLNLLRWLHALGSDVIVLSATLPTQFRDEMLEVWDAPPVSDRKHRKYPAMVEARDGRVKVHPFKADPKRRQEITVCFGDADEETVVERVAEAVESKATVAVICNLVRRAQNIYEKLRERLNLGDDDLVLLHARFPFDERQRRERFVVGYTDGEHNRIPGRFAGDRPDRPGVLVATQVAEQSLDLDVDLMLTDLAPVDLLLQRAGRLHRHERERPPGFGSPKLIVLRPAFEGDYALPQTRKLGGGTVYLNLPLFKTYRLLCTPKGQEWSLPDDYRSLVEAVYGSLDEPPGDLLTEEDRHRWKRAVEKAQKEYRGDEIEAHKRLIPSPERLHELVESTEYTHRAERDEDDLSLHEDLRPVTRLGISVEVVCLHRGVDDQLYLGPACRAEDAAPLLGSGLSHDDAERLLRAAVRLSREELARQLLAQELFPHCPGWTGTAAETPALHYHRPLVFEQGRCPAPPGLKVKTIRFDPALGIVYEDAAGNCL